jgi:hypothetical protein
MHHQASAKRLIVQMKEGLLARMQMNVASIYAMMARMLQMLIQIANTTAPTPQVQMAPVSVKGPMKRKALERLHRDMEIRIIRQSQEEVMLMAIHERAHCLLIGSLLTQHKEMLLHVLKVITHLRKARTTFLTLRMKMKILITIMDMI